MLNAPFVSNRDVDRVYISSLEGSLELFFFKKKNWELDAVPFCPERFAERRLARFHRVLSLVPLCLTHLELEGVQPRKSSPGNVHTSHVRVIRRNSACR